MLDQQAHYEPASKQECQECQELSRKLWDWEGERSVQASDDRSSIMEGQIYDQSLLMGWCWKGLCKHPSLTHPPLPNL